MRIEEFDFELPTELIAQEPLDRRPQSRLLHIDRKRDSFSDSSFEDFPSLLRADDVLVLNNTKVFPARLFGETTTGARIEVFLVEELEDNVWSVLAKPAKRLKPGKQIDFGHGLAAESVERTDDGRVSLRFEYSGDFYEILESIGKTPLPPYIKRDQELATDKSRYQTVYAKERGAIAAPTAGLHFSERVLAELEDKGVTIVEITLHVGYGTFEPVRVSDLKDHRVAAEQFSISEASAAILNEAVEDQRRIVAVGTTSTRALETAFSNGIAEAGKRSTELTITPGYDFKAVGAMLTNFHLPKSSLLVLISTFTGHDLAMNAYRHAVTERYRFYSYGDCMFIE